MVLVIFDESDWVVEGLTPKVPFVVGDWVVSCGQLLKCIKGSWGKFREHIYRMLMKMKEIVTADISLSSFWGKAIIDLGWVAYEAGMTWTKPTLSSFISFHCIMEATGMLCNNVMTICNHFITQQSIIVIDFFNARILEFWEWNARDSKQERKRGIEDLHASTTITRQCAYPCVIMISLPPDRPDRHFRVSVHASIPIAQFLEISAVKVISPSDYG